MALFLNESDVRGLLTMKECIDALETAFIHSSSGMAENVPRNRIRLPRGFLHLMSAAAVASDMTGFGYKAYTTFPRGDSKFLMMLYDGDQGGLLSVMEAGNLGQIRTGAASGLATRFMASEDADTVGILGTGFQARSQVEAICAVRPIKRIRAFSRNAANREAFASRMSQRLDVEVTPATSAEECIRGADIAVTITDSRDPVLMGEWLKDGAHVNAAGGNHWLRREVDEETVTRSSVIVVDDLDQAKAECGDLIWPAERGAFRWTKVATLADLVTKKVAGRPEAADVTLFESQGVALEDVAAALHVYKKARERGVGQELPF